MLESFSFIVLINCRVILSLNMLVAFCCCNVITEIDTILKFIGKLILMAYMIF